MAECAVILIRLTGATPQQQQTACLAYCDQRRYQGVSICDHPDDAAALVESGAVTVVVTAYDEQEDWRHAARVRRAGGRLEYVRTPHSELRKLVDVDELVGRMHKGGADVATIAQLLDQDTRDIRASLGRARTR